MTSKTGLASVGPGWADLVRRAFEALPEGHMIVQVKEKFGSLRIYFEPNETAYERSHRSARRRVAEALRGLRRARTTPH